MRHHGHRPRPLAPRDDEVPLPPGLEDERALRALDGVADDRLAFRRADLLVGDDHDAQPGQRRERAGGGKRLERPRHDDEASFHVEDAGPTREIAVPLEALERARRKNRVEMADERDRWLAPAVRPDRAHDEMVGELSARRLHPRRRETFDGEQLLERVHDGVAALDILGERVDRHELGQRRLHRLALFAEPLRCVVRCAHRRGL